MQFRNRLRGLGPGIRRGQQSSQEQKSSCAAHAWVEARADSTRSVDRFHAAPLEPFLDTKYAPALQAIQLRAENRVTEFDRRLLLSLKSPKPFRWEGFGHRRAQVHGRRRVHRMKPSAIASQPLSNTTPPTTNKHLIRWVEKMADLCRPEAIHWVDGSKDEYDAICERLIEAGTFIRLNQKKWPGCFYARSVPGDVARVEDRTFICSFSRPAAGPTNNWEDPYVMRRKLKQLF